MAVLDLEFVGSGAWASGATGPAPAYPTGLQENDICYLVVHNKPDTVTPSAPTDWTLVGTAAGGDPGATGADVGPTRVTVFKRLVPSGGLSGTQSLSGTLTDNSVALTHIRAYRALSPGAGLTYSEGFGSYSSSTASTNVGGTISPGLDLAAKDQVVIVVGTPTDTTTSLAVSGVAATGATFGTIANSPSGTFVSGTGNDAAAAAWHVPITAGASTTGPAITATADVAATSLGFAWRVRATDDTTDGVARTRAFLGLILGS